MENQALEMYQSVLVKQGTCIYCGNPIFTIREEDLLSDEWPSYLSPSHVFNVNFVEEDNSSNDKGELFCNRCGVFLGYKLIDRSGLIGDKNFISARNLQLSSC
jgi:peptide methionine sulfoxide reductase MsrB